MRHLQLSADTQHSHILHFMSGCELTAGAMKIDITHPAKKLVEPASRPGISPCAKISACDRYDGCVSIGEIDRSRMTSRAMFAPASMTSFGIPIKTSCSTQAIVMGHLVPNQKTSPFRSFKRLIVSSSPLRSSAGRGPEDRIQENRRMQLKNGGEIDVRHAYSCLPIKRFSPPALSILKLVFCESINKTGTHSPSSSICLPSHSRDPVSAGDTSDMTGYAAQVIENNLDEGTIALFVQGCGGDINPIAYKDVDQFPAMPRHLEICRAQARQRHP